MIDKEPKQVPQVEKIEDHSDIPLYEKLDEESQKFVVEVKKLSEMSEEEFSERYPDVKGLIEKSQNRWDDKSTDSARGIKGVLQEILDEFKPNILPPRYLADNTKDIGTMWDFVRLHLLELKDFAESGQPGYHSKQIDYLTEQIIRKIILNFRGPESAWGLLGKINQEEALTDDTSKRLIIISKILNAMHEHARANVIPPALYYIKDLWRYAIIRKNNIKGENIVKCWAEQFKDFFNKLSNINLKES